MICNVCNKRRAYTGSKGTETAAHGSGMCNYCYEEGGWENSHQDQDHLEAVSVEMMEDPAVVAKLAEAEGCWICHPKLNLAQKFTAGNTGPRKQGARRPQLNHKGHNHPQTPAARRACKQAFWAQDTVEAAAWDHRCDGFGKELPAPAPKAGGWAGVQPRSRNHKADMKAVGARVAASK